jgi:hypothetical protein
MWRKKSARCLVINPQYYYCMYSQCNKCFNHVNISHIFHAMANSYNIMITFSYYHDYVIMLS